MKPYDDGEDIKEQLENMKLSELLAINPTLEEMRHIVSVLSIHHGKSAQTEQWGIAETRKLLARKNK